MGYDEAAAISLINDLLFQIRHQSTTENRATYGSLRLLPSVFRKNLRLLRHFVAFGFLIRPLLDSGPRLEITITEFKIRDSVFCAATALEQPLVHV